MKNLIKIIVSLLGFIIILNAYAITPTGNSTSSGVTSSGSQVNIFKLTSIDTIYNDEYKLTFSHDLYKDGLPRDIQINDLTDAFATFNIISTTVSGSTLNLKLEKPLIADKEYEIIAIQIYDINLDNIEKGVNASKIFKTPKVFNKRPIENIITNTGITLTGNTNSNISSGIIEANIDLNSASDVNLNSIFKDIIPEKTTTTTNTKIVDTLTTAKEIKKLPVTGPAEWLLLSIALFFGLIVITFRRKYTN